MLLVLGRVVLGHGVLVSGAAAVAAALASTAVGAGGAVAVASDHLGTFPLVLLRPVTSREVASPPIVEQKSCKRGDKR